jgi:hypothetical protein
MKQVNHSTQRRLRGAVALAVLGVGLALGASPAFALNGMGLTYGVYTHDANFGIDRVGLFNSGNPYVGDTLCKKKLPVLCINVDGSPRPGYSLVPGGLGPFYEGWVEGTLQPTPPTKGSTLTSLAVADALCATTFGPGWRMAEFHDGAYANGMDATHSCNTVGCITSWQAGLPHGGHSMWGHGNLNQAKRYWTHINDQPGNCWD